MVGEATITSMPSTSTPEPTAASQDVVSSQQAMQGVPASPDEVA